MKKIFSIMLFLLLMSNVCFASSEYIEAFINKKIAINYGEDIYEYAEAYVDGERYQHPTKYVFENCVFYDVNHNTVFPISYEGTTYLPIRAISGLIGIKIKWDGETKSIYLGEGEVDYNAILKTDKEPSTELIKTDVLRNEDIKIYYNGDVQNFKDVNGKKVYPLSYNGTTYLPIRAVSELFDLMIEWENETKTIFISEKSNSKIFGDEEIKIDLALLTDEELEIALNENFAKYGHDFDTQRIEDYFMQKEWYQKVDGKKVSVTELTKQEQQNINKIQAEVALRKTYKDINVLEQENLCNIGEYKSAKILKDENNNHYAKIYNNIKDAIDVPTNVSKLSNVQLLPSKIYSMNENYNYYREVKGEIYYIPVEKANSYEEERIVLMEKNIEIYSNGDLVINNTKLHNFFNIEELKNNNDVYPKNYDNIIEFLVSRAPKSDAYTENIGFKYNFDNDLTTNEYIFMIASSEFEAGATYLSMEKRGVYIDSKNTVILTQDVSLVDYTTNLAGYSNLFARYSAGYGDMNENYSLKYYGTGTSMLKEYINENFVDVYYVFIPNQGFELVNRTLDGKNIDINKYVFTLKDELKLYSKEKYADEYGGLEWLEDDIDYSKYNKVWYHVNEPYDDEKSEGIILKSGAEVKVVLATGWWHIVFESEDEKEAYVIYFTPAGVT